MTVQFSVAARDAMLDAFETAVGTSAILEIRSGAQPANCAATATGTVLATLNLPSDWMANAASGSKALTGTWEDTSADATGTAGHYRIWDSSKTTCHAQGSITATGSGGDMTLDNTSIAAAQDVKVTSFSFTAGNS